MKTKNEVKTKSIQSQTASAIRKELKSAFPGIKFSVTSESFSMGDAVRVLIMEDNVTRAEVRKVVQKYQYSSYNAMEDCHTNDNSRNDIPQVKYVTVSKW